MDELEKVNETEVSEEEELETESDEDTGESNSGSGWTSEGICTFIMLAVVVVLIIALGLHGLYTSAFNKGTDSMELTKVEAIELIEAYFTPAEARALEYEINNAHYYLYQKDFGHWMYLVIHYGHSSKILRPNCDEPDNDITIRLYYDIVDDQWVISDYTWPNHTTCFCDECTCGSLLIA